MKKSLFQKIAMVIGIVTILLIVFFSHPKKKDEQSNLARIADVTYSCDKGHSIHAIFYKGSTAQPQPGQPPIPNGSVEINLDDEPTRTLSQTISADGARYSDGNPQIREGEPGAETFVFWNKGNTALILRNNAMDLNYTNCVVR